MGRLAIQNSLKCMGDTPDFYRSASKSDWYFILATGLKLRSIYRIVYMQTGVNFNTSAIKNRL